MPAVPYEAYLALAGATAELVRSGVRRGETDAIPALEDTIVSLLGAGADPVDRMTVAVLTTIIGETAREIAASSSRQEAGVLADAAITFIRRLDPLNPPDPS